MILLERLGFFVACCLMSVLIHSHAHTRACVVVVDVRAFDDLLLCKKINQHAV